jgi:CRP/FNR family cyclic AMP-dependent transcriptional regulator
MERKMVINVHSLDWLTMHMRWVDLPGYLGAALLVISFLMRRIIPLRIVTIASNVSFIAYSRLTGQTPALVLYVLLLVVNAVRLQQMRQLIRRVQAASQGEQTLGALKPFMRRRRYKAGQIVFHRNDVADSLYYVVSGKFCVAGIGVLLEKGAYVGELGLLAPDGRRTRTLECVADGEVLLISYEHVTELYYQNPDFGFHFLKLTASRLFHDIDLLQSQVESLRTEVAVLRSGRPG